MQNLSVSLKKMLLSEDFDRITISDLVKAAGYNRKTFYYHFDSMNSLLEWCIKDDTEEFLTSYDIDKGFSKILGFVMDYLEQNAKLLKSASQTVGSGVIHRSIYRMLYPAVMNEILNKKENKQYDREYLDFLGDFYTEAIAGILQKWLEKPELRNRRLIAENLKLLF